jgi:hypothetical protein
MNSAQLSEVIGNYCQRDQPGYAIMVNGPWGSGKTYFIKSFFGALDTHKMLFVSLYGVSSTSKIEDQVFSAMIGASDVSEGEIKKAGDFIGKIFGAFGDKAEGSAIGAFAATAGEALKNKALKNIGPDTILVFDDFERADMSKHQCLSKINEFVEHQKVKVIILCDESKIDDPKYLDYKEKVILHTNYLERTADEISEICFSTVRDFKCTHEGLFKRELVSIIEQFNFTNIRTIMHGLNCFNEIVNKLHDLDFKYKDDEVLTELMFPAMAYSAGYKDYSVDIGDLEKTSVDSVNQSVAYHMKKDSRSADIKLSKWEVFYDRVLSKSLKKVEFKSIFELVCRGFLSENELLDDMKRWDVKEYGPDHPITTFRMDEVVSDDNFNKVINSALDILDDKSYVFYSTAELYDFCKTFIFLYEHNSFEYSGNFGQKIKEFSIASVDHCLNHTEPSAFGCRDTDGTILNELFDLLKDTSEKLGKDKEQLSVQGELLQSLNKGEVKNIEAIGNQYSGREVLTSQYVSQILEALPEINNVTMRAFGIFLNKRYSSHADFSNLRSEIEPLSELAKGLKLLLDKTTNSLSKMMVSIVWESSEKICSQAQEYLAKIEGKSE